MKIATVIKPFKAKKKITIQITLSCKLPRYLRLKTSRACSLFFFKHGVKKPLIVLQIFLYNVVHLSSIIICLNFCTILIYSCSVFNNVILPTNTE